MASIDWQVKSHLYEDGDGWRPHVNWDGSHVSLLAIRLPRPFPFSSFLRCQQAYQVKCVDDLLLYMLFQRFDHSTEGGLVHGKFNFHVLMPKLDLRTISH